LTGRNGVFAAIALLGTEDARAAKPYGGQTE
jgi:hypothetical protein